MSSESVKEWLIRLAGGDQEAAQKLWERYSRDLVRLARRKLEGIPRRVADEEDVALSAFRSFCGRLAAGSFPRLNDREDLWRLLVAITARKALQHARRYRAEKHGGGRLRGESEFSAAEHSSATFGIEQVIGRTPSPEFACMVAENFCELLEKLGDESLRELVLLKLEGYTNDEIAGRLACTVRTVERKLNRIRQKWESAGS